MLLAVALVVVALTVLLAVAVGSGGEDTVVEITFDDVGDFGAGERGRVAVSVAITEAGQLADAGAVRLLGRITGVGAADVEVVSVEGDGRVAVEVVDGQFLFPSEAQPLTVRDLTAVETFALELAVAERRGPLELAVTLVSGEPVPTDRIALWGAQRYETAVRVSERTHPNGADTVYVTRAFRFADALTAASAAAAEGAPLLLAFENLLPRATRAEIARLAPERVVLVGGDAALTDAVAGELNALVDNTQRIAGSNRYDTAARAALEVFDSPSTVLIASGADAAHALAAVAGAAAEDAPVLLTRPDRLPDPTRRALAALTPGRIVVLGGSDVISTAVMRELRDVADDVRRVAGADRYETALEVAAAFFEPDGIDEVVLASDGDFHEALVAGPAAAAFGAPMLLTSRDAVSDAVLERLATLNLERLYVVGTVSGAVTDQARAAVTPEGLVPARARPLGDTATTMLGGR